MNSCMENWWGWPVLCSTSFKNVTLDNEMVLATITFWSCWDFSLLHNLQMSYLIEICLFCLAGIHLVPDNEQLLITKVDEHEGTSTFSYRSDPASDLISVSECEKINNFVGVHLQKCWLLSVLWLLSELAVKQFGKGR